MKDFKLTTSQIPLIYAIFGMLWILLTDRLLLLLEPQIEQLVQWQTYKGWLFVFLSTLIIYWLVARSMKQHEAAQEALAHSERLYRLLFNNNPLPMWVYDVKTLAFLEVNNAAVTKYQFSRNEFLELTLKDIRPPEEVPLLLEKVAQTTEPLSYAGEWRHQGKDEAVFPVEIVSHELVYNGRSARLVVAKDLTEQKRAEETLRQSELRFRKAIEYAPFPVAIHAENGDMLAVSQTWLELTGYAFEEISTINKWIEQAYGTEQPQIIAGIDKLYELDTRIDEGEFTIACKDGTQRIWEFSSTPLGRLPDGQRGVISMAVDITERKNAEKQMHLQSSALNAAANGIVITDVHGLVEWANPAFTKLTGYTLEDALGKNPRELVNSGVHARTFFEPLWHTVLSGNIWRGELINRRKDGTLYHEEEAITPVWNKDGVMTHFIAIKQDITKRKEAEKEREELLKQVQAQAEQMDQIMRSVPEGITLLDPDGRILIANDQAKKHLVLLSNTAVGEKLTTLGDLSLNTLLRQPAHGNWHELQFQNHIFELIPQQVKSGPVSQGWVLVLREVTEQKRIEEQLHRQERLAAIGQLAAGIAHDFNNLMAVILLYAEMLARSPRLNAKEKAQLNTINQQTKRAARLIDQILDFSRRSVFERQPLDLLSLLKEEVKLLQRTLSENIEIELVYAESPYIVQADITRIQQTILNLAFNARDAMPDGGLLQFKLSPLTVDRDDQAPLPMMPPGNWVHLSVKDTGTGIDPAVLDHIFEPFVTTKEPGKGTGLGLSQVHGIVAQHDGFITLQSEQGAGTTFDLYFPATLFEEGADVPELPETAVSGHGELLLVVEDEPDLRNALVESLTLLQYNVTEAANGVEALAILEQGTAVDLIICDVVMPKMGGVPFVQALQKQKSPPPVIFVTGHPLDKESDNLRTMGVYDVLPKPFHHVQLSYAIAAALNQSV